MYVNVSPVILVVFDIHVYQGFTSYMYTCSVRYCAMCFYRLIVLLFVMHLLYADIILTKIIYVIYLHCFHSVKIQINTNINTIHLKKTKKYKIKCMFINSGIKPESVTVLINSITFVNI